MKKIFYRLLKATKFLSRPVVRLLAAFPWSRRGLNRLYGKLDLTQKALFHQLFATIYRRSLVRGRAGQWQVDFAGTSFQMPLKAESFWLDWGMAVSIAGNDVEIKQTYQTLMTSASERPDLFIDIGANYGTHSLLFLVQGIQTLSFEPNRQCHPYFRNMCELNRVDPCLQTVALGECQGEVELAYPQGETWLGSTNAETVSRLGLSHELEIEKVPQKTLDDYLDQIGDHKTLIKIDTEGNELLVLKGSLKTIEAVRPNIILECWGEGRRDIYNFVQSIYYDLHRLPWSPHSKSKALTFAQLEASRATNFIAAPNMA